MHIFFSVGEPSGDQHAAHLIHELKRRHPDMRVSGFGGPLMEQAGCRLLHRLTDLAVMGVLAVLPLLGRFYRLVQQAGQSFATDRPDAVVLVDFPGFNWWIARKAKAAGIPVFYYLPPQLWAWAPWRVRRIRKFVDHVLSALPFEKEWYAKRGIAIEYVGHPIFDEVAARPLDREFAVRDPNRQPPLVGLLPGSRNGEVHKNWPIMLEVARRLHALQPSVRFLVACYKEDHRAWCREQVGTGDDVLPIELCVGKTPEIIARTDFCLMVSGSVSLELLARATPAAVLYKMSRSVRWFVDTFVACKYISLPNLMANRELMPEFYFAGDPDGDTQRIVMLFDTWLRDDDALIRVRTEMAELRDAVAKPGAIQRTAEAILSKITGDEVRRAA